MNEIHLNHDLTPMLSSVLELQLAIDAWPGWVKGKSLRQQGRAWITRNKSSLAGEVLKPRKNHMTMHELMGL